LRSYRLAFLRKATKEWNKLGPTLRRQFENKLAERLRNPKVPSARLADYPDLYKIKLKSAGYRLIYRVDDWKIVVTVVKIGQREGGRVYERIGARLKDLP
jgi:mRNA interferase RelE/StbE